MNIGDKVRIIKCDVCYAVVGKIARINGLTMLDSGVGISNLTLNFGRGRPQTDRPHIFNVEDVELITEHELVAVEGSILNASDTEEK